MVSAAGRWCRGGFRTAAATTDAHRVQQRAAHAAAARLCRASVVALPGAVRGRVHRLLARLLGVDRPALWQILPAVLVLDWPRRRVPRPPQVRPKPVRATVHAGARPQGQHFQLSHQIQDLGECENCIRP